MSPADELRDHQETLRRQVLAAFAGVSRAGGVSWAEAAEEPNAQAGGGFRDTDTSWQELASDPDWNPATGPDVFDNLDEISYPYYVAAAMIRTLDAPASSELDALCFLPEEIPDQPDSRWSRLDQEQRVCIRAYLKYMVDVLEQKGRYRAYHWYEHLHEHWIFKDLEGERESVRGEILNAFADVSREGGVSWADTEVADRYESPPDNPFHDRDHSWADLIDDADWDPEFGHGGYAFLDAIGFRYYIPAAMVRSLRDPIADATRSALSPLGSPPCDIVAERWSALSAPQRRAIQSYLRYQMKLVGDDSWDEVWAYWESI